MEKLFIACLIIFSTHELVGQNETWYFNDGYGIEFKNGLSGIVKHKDPKISAANAFNGNGDLLFYTNGFYVWDKNDNYMQNGEGIIPYKPPGIGGGNFSDFATVVKRPSSNTQYFIIFRYTGRLYYSIVDMSLNGGLGAVTQQAKKITNESSLYNTIVNHSYNNSQWLITYLKEGSFKVYNINKNGIDTVAVESKLVGLPNKFGGRSIITSHDGKKIGVTYNFHSSGANATGEFMLFDFDKICGTVSNPMLLKRASPHWHCSALCFSPNNKRLYATFKSVYPNGGQSTFNLVQYSEDDFSLLDTVVIINAGYPDYEQFSDLELGPDNKLYLSTNKNRIDAIVSPNNSAQTCGYTKGYFSLPVASRAFYINYRDRTVPGPNPDNPGLSIEVNGICMGDSTFFSIIDTVKLDSVLWDFGDTLTLGDTSTQHNTSYLYPQEGKYTATLTWYRCNTKVDQPIDIVIEDFNTDLLSNDTTLCFNDSIELKSPISNVAYTWSTGEQTPSITVKESGLYWLEVSSGKCLTKDSITITELPPILIDLGEGYTVCEHDTDDLVKLDAGKGYSKYKWTPTQDTTQWIIVKQAGDYYVVVEDYRGCKGDDGSKVARLCNFDFHLPNAFTPNGDGLNDIFKPTALDIVDVEFEIFSTWGERVFMTNNPQQGWDGTYKGKPCQQGTYLYKISFKGYSNKLLRNYNFKGNVSLLR